MFTFATIAAATIAAYGTKPKPSGRESGEPSKKASQTHFSPSPLKGATGSPATYLGSVREVSSVPNTVLGLDYPEIKRATETGIKEARAIIQFSNNEIYPKKPNPNTPTYFTHRAVESNVFRTDKHGKKSGWAMKNNPEIYRSTYNGPEDNRGIHLDKNGHSFEGPIKFQDIAGHGKLYPKNPRLTTENPSTGIQGQGILGSFGPNHAVDNICTRINPNTQDLEVLLIERKDTQELALVGGFQEGDDLSTALQKEFNEEAGNLDNDSERLTFKKVLSECFDPKNIIFQGFVDDRRNTDNAWIETTAVHFHIPDEHVSSFKSKGGDDAANSQWIKVSDILAQNKKLYANHLDIVTPLFSKLMESMNQS
ncbi:hypothetical protein DID78_00710 [Candidatus Marinamargulisbacteria bacterium SCGC AG-343-D04]|nr:hypothetical protein DID78_00710 [Candidatus Marinamargulisbacteria bacterium SCGC AG-343-D04]